MISEDTVSNSTNSGNSGDENSEAGNGISFRIRNVDEINSTVHTSTADKSSETVKRKLPTWLGSPTEEIDEKRSRINSNNPSTTRNDEASESGSINNVNNSSTSNSDQNVSNTSDKVPSTETNACVASGVKVECGESGADEGAGAASPNAEDMDTNEACASSDQVDTKLVKTEVKSEPAEAAASSSTSDTNADTKTNVVKQEATSSIRDSCKFGIKCYRRNPAHKAELAHPGDSDYRRPDYPPPPKGTPDCPYGDRCYRRNPIHFQDYSHPPSTDFKKNWQLRQKRLRKQKKDPEFEYYDDDEDELEEDPFESDASSDEYIPSDDE